MKAEENNDENWSNEVFDGIYDKLVDVKNDNEYEDQCSKVFDYAGHMFSIVCTCLLLSKLVYFCQNLFGNCFVFQL